MGYYWFRFIINKQFPQQRDSNVSLLKKSFENINNKMMNLVKTNVLAREVALEAVA
jgi:hypothetical protein